MFIVKKSSHSENFTLLSLVALVTLSYTLYSIQVRRCQRHIYGSFLFWGSSRLGVADEIFDEIQNGKHCRP